MNTVPPEVAIQAKGIGLGWIWSSYNLIMLGIALLILLDVPRPSLYEWFNLHRTARITVTDTKTVTDTNLVQDFWGTTTMISEVGAEIALTQLDFPIPHEGEVLPVTIEILEHHLILSGRVVQVTQQPDFLAVRVMFEQVTLAQQRLLVEMLFCRPGQWKRRTSPGEFESLVLLFRILLRPRVLFDRHADVSAVSVAQV